MVVVEADQALEPPAQFVAAAEDIHALIAAVPGHNLVPPVLARDMFTPKQLSQTTHSWLS